MKNQIYVEIHKKLGVSMLLRERTKMYCGGDGKSRRKIAFVSYALKTISAVASVPSICK